MSKKKITLIVFLIPPLIWIASFFLLYTALPDWQTRGLFGDMFGATNALISSLALIGVILSIILQKNEFETTIRAMTKQLTEMEKSRILSSLPLPIINIKKCYIENPRLYYSPPDKKHQVLSRYFVEYNIENKSNYLVADINVTSLLNIYNKGNDIVLSSAGKHISSLSSLEISPEKNNNDFMFVRDDESCLFESLRSGKLPELEVTIIYKNIIGSYFSVSQKFNIDVKNEESDELLKKWHSLISSFPINHKNDLAELKILKAKNLDDKWELLFEEVKKKVSQSTKGDSLDLNLREIPGTFSVNILTKDEFLSKIKSVYFGMHLPVLRNGCVAK